MHNIREGVKIDTAIRANTNDAAITGEWFRMDAFAKALFFVTISGQLTGADCNVSVYEATNAEGDDESILGAAVTLTQGVRVTSAQAVCQGTTSVGETLIITPYYFNGLGVLTAGTALTFTAAAAESLPNRQWNQSSTTTVEAASIAACINDATYGVPGLLASPSTATVTITCTEPGGGDRTVLPANNGTAAFDITEEDPAKLVVTDLIQQAYFEVAVQDLDRDNDFTHVGIRMAAAEVTTEYACLIIRAMQGYGPVGQAVVAYDDAA